MACKPKNPAASLTKSGLVTAAVLMLAVRTGIEQAADVGYGAYTAADGQWNENLWGNVFDDVQNGVAVVGRQ